jgi:ribA/ribD-fused uncharacterized protein
MAMKAKKWKTPKNDELFQIIINTNKPKDAKALGRKVEKYDEEDWNSIRLEVMKQGLRAEFSDQNPEYKQKLLDTGSKILVEASPYDKIWGIGMKAADAYKLSTSQWNKILRERNLLGKALMEIREELRN